MIRDIENLREDIRIFLKLEINPEPIAYRIESVDQDVGYRRLKIVYQGREGDDIPAYFLVPDGQGPFPGVLVHHQHHGERHWGKSEVCGLVGNPLQAFGPTLARCGIAVLAPDSICFEDRRRNQTGTEPGEGDSDIIQHFNEVSYRLLKGDTLMRKILDDASRAISFLEHYPALDGQNLGVLGHSYGGNTVLFQAALDERIRFACSSGAACSFRYKLAHETGIEFAEVIPGFLEHYEISDLVSCIAPRATLIISATEDQYSKDAPNIVEAASHSFKMLDAGDKLVHMRYEGGHSLTKDRFDEVIGWLAAQCQ